MCTHTEQPINFHLELNMATRHGWEKAQALLEKGWKIKEDNDAERIGDPIMIDPRTGIEYTPYQAERIQHEREIVRYGYYSPKADSYYGTVVYKTPDGKEVYVTGVFESKESAEENYRWPDKVFVSEVTEFVRSYKRTGMLFD